MSTHALVGTRLGRSRLLISSFVAATFSVATAQTGLGSGGADRPDSLAVGSVDIAAATEIAAEAEGSAVALARLQEGIEARLATDLAATRKFTMVTRSRLDTVLAEQSLAASGFIDADDPSTARSLRVAGVRWLAVPRIVDFEDMTRTRRFEGLDRTVERRTIRL
ncbi:MAG: CsgG/HfaB family protein, partial [Planctomycetota bacterium]